MKMRSWQDTLNDLEQEFLRYEASLKAEASRLALLRKIDNLLLKRSFSPDIIFDTLMRGALELLGAEFGQLLLLSPDKQQGDKLEIVWTSGQEPKGTLVDIDNCVSGLAVKEKKVKNIPDASKEPLYQRYLGKNINSELVAPMLDTAENGDVALGVINIESPQLAAFDENAEQFLGTLAGQAALAIRILRIQEHFGVIVETQSRIFSESWNLNKTLAFIAEKVQELLKAEHCQILLAEEDHLVIAYTTGNEKPGTGIDKNSSVSGEAFTTGQPKNVPDNSKEPLYRQVLLDMQSELAVPTKFAGEPLGVINVESKRLAAFTEYDEYILRLFADQAAIAISNARMLDERARMRRQQLDLAALAQVGHIAGNAMHQLNNVLGLIPGLVNDIKRKRSDLLQDEFLRTKLEDIYNKAIAALEIPEQLTAQKSLLGELEKLDVNEVLLQVVDSLSCPDNIFISHDLSEELPSVHYPKRLFEEVVKNLMKNAIEAMKDGGQLTFGSGLWVDKYRKKEKIEGVEIWIEDTGVGIPREKLYDIFEYGYSTKGRGHGLGYGLWWVKTTVELWGGFIILESEEGKGTKFTLRLPMRALQFNR